VGVHTTRFMNYPLLIGDGGQCFVEKVFDISWTNSFNACLKLVLIIWMKFWKLGSLHFFVSREIPMTLKCSHQWIWQTNEPI